MYLLDKLQEMDSINEELYNEDSFINRRNKKMVILENEYLKVEIATMGAEIQRIFNKEEEVDYLWNGNAEFWNGRAPVLFPIVGRLNDNQYTHDGKTFEMNQHGFARKEDWTAEETTATKAVFVLKENEDTKEKYPFDFILKTIYTLSERSVKIDYVVENRFDKTMPYSLGSHPAFNVPIGGKGMFEDYSLTMEPALSLEMMEMGPAPYRSGKKKPLDELKNGILELKRDLFQESMLIDTKSAIETVTLSSDKTKHGVRLHISEFPYLCLWTKEEAEAPFLCIEPFHGIPDVFGEVEELSEKEGILLLDPNETNELSYTIELF